MEQLNIIVVGGGMIGLATALALANAGFDGIGVIEHQGFPIFNEDETRVMSARVSAITPASVDFLKQIDVWARLPQTRLGSIDQMQVWEDYEHPMWFSAANARAATLGYIIENDVLVAKLAERVREQPAIKLLLQHKPEILTKTHDGFILTLADGQQLKTLLMIGADGAKSWVREQLSVTITTHDYQQTALIAHIESELPHQHIARQRFDVTSTCAFLPLAHPNQVSLVWSVDKTSVDTLLALTPAAFAQRLSTHMHACLGDLNLLTDIQHLPLISRRATAYTQAHAALVGDAARSVHPLAGQGVNLGLMDVVSLTATLVQARQEQRNIAAAYVLKHYEREAKARAQRFLGMIDGVFRLFKVNYPLANRIRQIGFESVAECQPILSWLTRQAMGTP